MAGNEDMLHGDLANIWEEIQQKFPYYKTMEQFYGSNPLVNLSAVTNSRSDIKTDVLCHGGDDDDGDVVDVDDEHTPVTPKSKSSRRVFPSPDDSLADTVDSIQTTPATGPSMPRRKRPVDASSDIELTETLTCPVKNHNSASSVSKTPAPKNSSSQSAPSKPRRRTVGDQIVSAVLSSNKSFEETIQIKAKAKHKT
ncbi:hypothetical protein PQX77_018428 [Marasmius sp. AFHP31]|nr:hypothetical protein PQX77_018428 [Marasmius sp. AFHP31]